MASTIAIKRLHMEAVIAAGLWSHPFGLPE